MQAATFVTLCYAFGVPLLAAFAAYALIYAHRAAKAGAAGVAVDAESFVTARRSQGLARIGWSFYCGSVGEWRVVCGGRERRDAVLQISV